MRHLTALSSAIALSSFLVAAPAQAQPQKPTQSRADVERQMDRLTQAMVQAQLHGDPAPYQQYYAENAVIIHAAGQVFTKAEEIANLKSGETKYESYDVRDKKIHVYGNTAVVELLAAVKGTLKGQPFDSEFRVTRVWLRSKSKWNVVVFQTTRVAPPGR